MAMRASQVASARIAAKTVEMGEGPDIGLLHHILGLAVVAQDAAGEPVEPAVVRLHDAADGGFIARQRAGDQRGVGGPGCVYLRKGCVAHGGLARSVDRLLLTVGCGKAQ